MREQIVKKYEELSKNKCQKLNEYNDKIDACCQNISEYFYFSIQDLGNILVSLISTFEGTNYIYQDTYYFKKEVKRLAFDTEETMRRTRLRIIVAEEYKSNLCSDDMVHSLVENGKAIVLSDTETVDDQISFYAVASCNHSLEQCIEFGRFSYVKDFIDGLILYKIAKKSKVISYEELKSIELDYIASHAEQIEENYRLIGKQREEQMQQKLDVESKKRQLLLKGILDRKKNS